MSDPSQALRYLIENAYRSIMRHPDDILMEQPGGPVGMTADVVIARLIGADNKVEREMRVDRARQFIDVPVYVDAPPTDVPTLVDGVRRYELQNGCSTGVLNAELAPDETHGPDGRVKVLCLRYRRQLSS